MASRSTGEGFTNGGTPAIDRWSSVRSAFCIFILHGGDLPAADRTNPAPRRPGRRRRSGTVAVSARHSRGSRPLCCRPSRRSVADRRASSRCVAPVHECSLLGLSEEKHMPTQAEKGRPFASCTPARNPAAAQPVGCRHRQAPAVAGLRGAGHHQPRHVECAGPRRRRAR